MTGLAETTGNDRIGGPVGRPKDLWIDLKIRQRIHNQRVNVLWIGLTVCQLQEWIGLKICQWRDSPPLLSGP